MSTEFKELHSYPGAAFNPIGGDLLGEPDDYDQHVQMWADALFESNQVPCAKGGWDEGDEVEHRQGLRVCKECGVGVMVWSEYDVQMLNRHRAYHDKLYDTACKVVRLANERKGL